MTGRDLDKLPLAELCKPLSAKVMPASAKYSISGNALTDRAAMIAQRKVRQPVPKFSNRKART